MSSARAGFSLLEVLVVAAILVVLLGSAGAVLMSSQRAFTVQQRGSRAAESAEIAAALLAGELKTADYVGGDAELSAVTAANRVSYLVSAYGWPFDLAPLQFTAGTGTCASACDSVAVARVTSVTAAGAFGLERVTYAAHREASGTYVLTRRVDAYACPAPSGGSSACSLSTRGTDLPAVEGVEDFEVAFQATDGAYYTAIGSGAGRLGSTGIAAVVVYLRVRSPDAVPGVVDGRAYPAIDLPGTGGAAGLGIPAARYSGADAAFERVEKLITVKLLNRQRY